MEEQIKQQIRSCIAVCEGRILNGAKINEAFEWLEQEIEEAFVGRILYED